MSITSDELKGIEFFHLAFLHAFESKVRTEKFVLKGGSSLRYFMESERYSNDINLDIRGMEGWKLKESVDEVMSSSLLQKILASKEIGIIDSHKDKQTDKIQKWKPELSIRGVSNSTYTKIEFSHTDEHENLEVSVDRVSRKITSYHNTELTIQLQRYAHRIALWQTINNLCERKEPQACDVFDIRLLARILNSNNQKNL